jgi:hypothetical protein
MKSMRSDSRGRGRGRRRKSSSKSVSSRRKSREGNKNNAMRKQTTIDERSRDQPMLRQTDRKGQGRGEVTTTHS